MKLRFSHCFSVAIVLVFGAALFLLEATWLPHHLSIAKGLLGIVGLAFALWFILGFTRCFSAEPGEKQEQLSVQFQFAYVFTLVCFALLTLPFTLLVDEHAAADAAPIQLLRGCVAPDPTAGDPKKERVIPLCDDKVAPGDERTFPWLVSIGGVKAKARAMPTDRPTSQGEADEPNYYYEVQGGFYLPLYVVLIAFIGGAVSLSRRIPEYQKRTDCDYTETETEMKLEAYQAREAVVFQVMQLISAPFIAMTAYFAIEPETVAASVGLAFAAGFASETILLMIRAVVEGIRPRASAPLKPKSGTLKLKVMRDGAKLPGAKIFLDKETQARAETDSNGEVQIVVPAGAHSVRADSGSPKDVKVVADQMVELSLEA